MTAHSGDELAQLRAENARLAGLLEAHGVAWRVPEAAAAPAAMMPLTIDEKVALFRRLFRGRTDVYGRAGTRSARAICVVFAGPSPALRSLSRDPRAGGDVSRPENAP